MLFAPWYLRLSTGSPTPSRRPKSRPTRSRRSVLPRLELMDDRKLLSTFTVTSLSDSSAHSLRAGIQSGDAIIAFAPGLHGTITLGSELPINHSVTIDGPGANELSVSGNNANRVFEIATGQVAISGLTITDGHELAANGGGILVDAGATLNLDQVVVSGNSAYADSSGDNFGSGGGIENDGSLTVTQSFFTKNLASGGSSTNTITEGSAGGAIDSQGPSLTVTNCAFLSNQAVGPATGTGEGNGGAINTSSPGTITDSKFKNNQALGRTTNGGAISMGENENFAAPSVAISNSTFTKNEAVGANGANNSAALFGGEALGGAIANAGPLTIANSTFTDNTAKGGDDGDNVGGLDPNPVLGEAWGGGLVNFASVLTITNTSFSGNQAIGGNSATGPGAPAAGGGLASEIMANTTLTGVTFLRNQAIGGSGGSSSPGYPGTGGSGFGGGFYNGVDSTAAVSGAQFGGNLAKGGSGGPGAAGGVGAGGAIANGGGIGEFELAFLGLGPDTSKIAIAGGTQSFNVAQGGAGGAGSNGGDGSGGGVYVLGTTTGSIDGTLITFDSAMGGASGTGGASGQGSGGGLYIDAGAGVTLSKSSKVRFNFASTGNDDIFGAYTTS